MVSGFYPFKPENRIHIASIIWELLYRRRRLFCNICTEYRPTGWNIASACKVYNELALTHINVLHTLTQEWVLDMWIIGVYDVHPYVSLLTFRHTYQDYSKWPPIEDTYAHHPQKRHNI